MEQTKTHWKKNVDSRYISGEDLLNGEVIGKGLRPEMVVVIKSQTDADAYDQGSKESVKKTALYLFDVQAKKDVYKPLLLNKSLVDFCRNEFKSDFIEDWFEKPFVLYAQPDKRHGHVARARKHVIQKQPLKLENMANILAKVKSKETNLETIEKYYILTEDQRKELQGA
jgi:hypothetical protein